MKAKRYNPCAPIRNALLSAGYSTVKVMNAVNSALGELEAKSEESKLADGRITKSAYKVTESVSVKYEGSVESLPLRFDAFCGKVEAANKIASFETIAIPGIFTEWLNKFAKADKEAIEKEKAAIAAS